MFAISLELKISDLFSCSCVYAVTGLFCCNFCLEKASCKSEVSDEVKKLVTGTLVFETELKIVQVSVFADVKFRDFEQLGHSLDLFLGYRMLDYDDGVVNIPSLYEIVVEQEFEFMEENECPACPDLLRVDDAAVPTCCLYSENPGVEVYLYLI